MARLTRKQAIRKKCIDCSGFSLKEVRECRITTCALHPFRMGRTRKALPIITPENQPSSNSQATKEDRR